LEFGGIDGIIGGEGDGGCGVKWFFLASFVASIFCSLVWTALIIFAIATGRLMAAGIRGVAIVAPLLFFIYGARETYGFYREARDK